MFQARWESHDSTQFRIAVVTELSVATEIEDEPIKWKLSDIVPKANLLISRELNYHAKMAPDNLVDHQTDPETPGPGQVILSRKARALRCLMCHLFHWDISSYRRRHYGSPNDGKRSRPARSRAGTGK